MHVSTNTVHNVMMGMLGAVTTPEKEAQRLGGLVSKFTNETAPHQLLDGLVNFVHLPPETSGDVLVKSAMGAVDSVASFVGKVLQTQAKHFNLSEGIHMGSPEAHSAWVAKLTGADSLTSKMRVNLPWFNYTSQVTTEQGGFNPLNFMLQRAKKGELSKEALTQALAKHIEANKLPLVAVDGKLGHFTLTGDAAKTSAFTMIAHHNGLGTVANGRYAAYVHNPWDAKNPVHFTTVVSDMGELVKGMAETNRFSAVANELPLAEKYLNAQNNVEAYLSQARAFDMPKPVKALVEQHLTTDNPNPKAFVQALDTLVSDEAGKVNMHGKQPLNYWAVTNQPHYYGGAEKNIFAKLTTQALPHMPQVNELTRGIAEQTALMNNPHATATEVLLPLNKLMSNFASPESLQSFINPNVLNMEAVGQPASALHKALHEATGLDLAKLAVPNPDTGLVNVEATRHALDTAIATGELPNWQRLEQFPNRYQHTHPETGEVTHVGLGNSIALNHLADGKGWTHLVPTPDPTTKGEQTATEAWQVLDPTSMIGAVQTKFTALGEALDNAPPEQWQAQVIDRIGDVVKADNSLAKALKIALYVDNLKTSGLTALEQAVQAIPQESKDTLSALVNKGFAKTANTFKGATTFDQATAMMNTVSANELAQRKS